MLPWIKSIKIKDKVIFQQNHNSTPNKTDNSQTKVEENSIELNRVIK